MSTVVFVLMSSTVVVVLIDALSTVVVVLIDALSTIVVVVVGLVGALTAVGVVGTLAVVVAVGDGTLGAYQTEYLTGDEEARRLTSAFQSICPSISSSPLTEPATHF